jgi:hypothetical protein
MTIEQTVEIPEKPLVKMLHLDLPLPEDHPSGRVKVEVRLTPAQYAEIDGVRYKVPTEEEARRWREDAIKNDTRLQEILKIAAEHAEARRKDPSLDGSLKESYGVLENSKAWGKGIDVVAKIRQMRDEWDKPLESEVKNG